MLIVCVYSTGVAGTCSGSTAPDAGTEDDVGAAEAVQVVPAELDDDPYDWLHHPTQSALDLIERENQLTVDAMKHTSRLQKSLLKELKVLLLCHLNGLCQSVYLTHASPHNTYAFSLHTLHALTKWLVRFVMALSTTGVGQ